MSEKATNPIWVKAIPENDGLLPKYQTPGSAACDLVSNENVAIEPGERAIVGTGIKLEIPTGFGAMVCSRSGLAVKNGIQVLNAPGIVDCDYRGEVKVILLNTGDDRFIVRKGDRIAQLLFFPIFQAIFQKADDISQTQRGEGGFGSTGV